jgi:hypothetical protein
MQTEQELHDFLSSLPVPAGVVRWAALDNTLLRRNVMRSDELIALAMAHTRQHPAAWSARNKRGTAPC